MDVAEAAASIPHVQEPKPGKMPTRIACHPEPTRGFRSGARFITTSRPRRVRRRSRCRVPLWQDRGGHLIQMNCPHTAPLLVNVHLAGRHRIALARVLLPVSRETPSPTATPTATALVLILLPPRRVVAPLPSATVSTRAVPFLVPSPAPHRPPHLIREHSPASHHDRVLQHEPHPLAGSSRPTPAPAPPP